MKEIYHRGIAAGLALLVCLATFSFKADLHFCGDHLVDVSFRGETSDCGMMPLDGAAEEGCDLMGIPCCSDLELVRSGEDLNPASFEWEPQKVFSSSPQFVSLYSGSALSKPSITLPPYKAPPLIRDHTVWMQVFRL